MDMQAEMGTHARVTIRRPGGDLIIWIRYDGSVCALGTQLCELIRVLLATKPTGYWQTHINNMTASRDGLPLSFDSGDQLMEVFTRREYNTYANDECTDIEYEYLICFTKRYLAVSSKGRPGNIAGVKLSFDNIIAGRNIEEFTLSSRDLSRHNDV